MWLLRSSWRAHGCRYAWRLPSVLPLLLAPPDPVPPPVPRVDAVYARLPLLEPDDG